jgi:hypothetical protein
LSGGSSVKTLCDFELVGGRLPGAHACTPSHIFQFNLIFDDSRNMKVESPSIVKLVKEFVIENDLHCIDKI